MLLPPGGGESTNLENMEDLYASARSQGTEEEDNIYFPTWKETDGYQDTVDTTSLLANFAAMFPEVTSLLNSCI